MRRFLLFIVLLAVLVGVVYCLTKLKGEEQPVPTPAASARVTAAAPTAAPTEQPGETTAAPSPTAQPLPSADPLPTAAAAETPNPTPYWTQTGEEGELTVRLRDGEAQVPAYRREYILRESPRLSFRLLVPGELMEPRYEDNAWYFPLTPQGEGEASAPAWLEISHISGATAEELLPDFMSAYLSFREIEFSGSSILGGVTMDETITASGDELLVKAWLLDVPRGVFAAVLCCSLDRLEPDLSYLEAVLGTLTVTVEK